MKNSITMRDIAERLGVSIVTVSKAINDKEGVGEELRQKIKDTAVEMGYRLNLMAKSMKEGVSYNIGVIVAERFVGPGQSFYMQFYQYLSKLLEEEQFSGILHVLSPSDEEELALPRIYYERKVDGFILLGQLAPDYVEAVMGGGLPAVLLDFYTENTADCVVADNFFGMYEMTNYLIREGHRKFAFVGNLHSTSSIQDRFLGFYKALLEHHLPLDPSCILNDRDEAGRYIEIDLPDPMPTAFVCNCDQVAFNLIQSLRRRNVRVPEDCSVVGFDNDIFATLAEPKLTTVEVNVPEMARAAVRTVMEKIRNNNATGPGRMMIKGGLVFRESVGSASQE